MRTDTNSGCLELRGKESPRGTKISVFSREKSKLKFQFYEKFLNQEAYHLAIFSFQSSKNTATEKGAHLTWIKGNRPLYPELLYLKGYVFTID